MKDDFSRDFYDAVMGTVNANLGQMVQALGDRYRAMQSVTAYLADHNILVSEAPPFAWRVEERNEADGVVRFDVLPNYPIAIHRAMAYLVAKLEGHEPDPLIK